MGSFLATLVAHIAQMAGMGQRGTISGSLLQSCLNSSLFLAWGVAVSWGQACITLETVRGVFRTPASSPSGPPCSLTAPSPQAPSTTMPFPVLKRTPSMAKSICTRVQQHTVYCCLAMVHPPASRASNPGATARPSATHALRSTDWQLSKPFDLVLHGGYGRGRGVAPPPDKVKLNACTC